MIEYVFQNNRSGAELQARRQAWVTCYFGKYIPIILKRMMRRGTVMRSDEAERSSRTNYHILIQPSTKVEFIIQIKFKIIDIQTGLFLNIELIILAG